MKAKAIVASSDVEEILFARGLNPGSYGCNEANLEIAKKTFEELEKGGKFAYVSRAIDLAMHTLDWQKHRDLLNVSFYVYGKDYRIFPISEFAENFKKWKEEFFSQVKKVTIIVAPPVRDEYKIKFKNVFLSNSDVLILSAELPEKEEGFWSSDESPEDREKLEEKWKKRKSFEAKFPKKVVKAVEIFERVFS
ncbi:MAG TPA: hypothetical protein P5323_02890 [Candidatus Moranbacteria bacterium]|nr:hypothetical protein [Candidatus Moranbacteria bacterium]HRY28060.1 hypothetical protein [Candidatus Moranbacteria bacterium]HSA07865.1 hypothetical protein [Candidatus Moranbacteria bacterium]